MSPEKLPCDIVRDGLWYVACHADLELASQGASPEEAINNLAEALLLNSDPPQSTVRKPLSVAGPNARKAMTFREVRFKLESAGFRGVIQRGNHAKLVKDDGEQTRTAILPHFTELAGRTVASIISQSGLSATEFDGL